ncbi:GvpL/GvpF family gas vesicle protein [Streptomyces sp. NBC_00690]|uniref:GvpL/GvpF family gas vesicle protein n=1 Tax=Streptomyces sp. NBC_00690 TaxID=2975808 RepID=UPI002E27BD16|nr:GvpL/GvpF family gas vesicle protein [Streptomyces sp. NBC_00690]
MITVAPGVSVYAIIRAGAVPPGRLTGVGGPAVAVRAVSVGKVAAVVSDAPAQLRARRRDLLAHQELLMALAEVGPVLPMRFGVVAPDEEVLREQLAAEEMNHLATLDRLVGHLEMNVKVLPAQDALGALVAADTKVRRLREEARRRPGYDASVRLGEAVVAALSRRAIEAGRRMMRDLAPMARATVQGPEVSGCALNVSFLVERVASERFGSTVEHFAKNHREHLEVRLAGPLPCYSFVGAHTPAPLIGKG